MRGCPRQGVDYTEAHSHMCASRPCGCGQLRDVRDADHDAISVAHDVGDLRAFVVVQKVKGHITKGLDRRIVIASEDQVRIGFLGVGDRVNIEGVRVVRRASILRRGDLQPNSNTTVAQRITPTRAARARGTGHT